MTILIDFTLERQDTEILNFLDFFILQISGL
jgi:hypothetical protein